VEPPRSCNSCILHSGKTSIIWTTPMLSAQIAATQVPWTKSAMASECLQAVHREKQPCVSRAPWRVLLKASPSNEFITLHSWG
jgi:hypothetical protein